MDQSRGISFVFLLLLLLGFGSCRDDFEDYSKNPRNLLSFSVDTLRFDTVLSTVNTPFKAFMVYNRNEKALLISSVKLKRAGESGFKINVDGMAGNEFNDVEIRANDSLYILVDIKPEIQGNNQPAIINDYIEFTTNGQQQNVVLEACGQDVVVWKGISIATDTVLDSRKPFLIYDSLVVEEGVVVDAGEGTTFYMYKNAEIIVKGTLRLSGTSEKPVVVRGYRTDALLGIPYDLIPGQWRGIRFTATSFNNVFEYVHIRNGSSGIVFEPSSPDVDKLTMKQVKLSNFKGPLLHSVNCRIKAENCEFSNSQEALLTLIGGNYTFIHCTMANYYASAREAGWGNSDNETVRLLTYCLKEDGDTVHYSIEQAAFYNTIIWGMKEQASSEIQLRKSGDAVINYYFENCLINADATNDDVNDPSIVPTVVNCIINKNPEFLDTSPLKDGKDEFIYDFRIDSISPALNVANRQVAERIPYDMNGVSRLSDDGPDIGAYERK
ncbi:MAG: hypothetical protein LBP72_08565 [Dysgonamonadaceae bacterium]|jgi:spore coat protein U-like protein|nr:hypothetical protein [Dysgonamonadaceae bacterium]